MVRFRKNKEIIILSTILLLAIIIRILGVNQLPITPDESVLVLYIQKAFTFSESLTTQYHPPIFEIISRTLYTLFGANHVPFRLTIMFFGIVTIIFSYLTSKEKYGKKTALISLLLISFSFWHILASLQIERDGAILTSFFTLSAYFLLRYEKTSLKKYLILLGISISLAILTKTSSLILIIFCAIYVFLIKKNLIKAIKILFIPYLIGVMVTLFYFMLLFFFNIGGLILTTFFYSVQSSSGFNPNIIFYLILWGTPLIIFPIFAKLFKYEKKDLIFYLWIFVTLLMFLKSHHLAALDRYLMIIIPPLCILSARLFSSIKLNKSYLASIIFGALLYTLFLINLKVEYIPHNLSNYFQRIILFDWNFYFPITGPAGPAFGLSFYGIILSLLISGLSIIIFIITLKLKKYHISKFFVCVFIIISISLNFYYIINYISPSNLPNIDQTTRNVIGYYNNKNLKGTVISNTLSLRHFLNKIDQKDFFRIIYGTHIHGINDIDNIILKKEEVHAIIINYPIIDKQNSVYKYINEKCNLIKTFKHKEINMAEIFNCTSISNAS